MNMRAKDYRAAEAEFNKALALHPTDEITLILLSYSEFIDNGGQVWLCGACTKPRGITEDQVVKGATIVGAAKVVEEVVAGAKAVAFA